MYAALHTLPSQYRASLMALPPARRLAHLVRCARSLGTPGVHIGPEMPPPASPHALGGLQASVHAGGVFDGGRVSPAEIVAVVRAAIAFADSIGAQDVSLHPPRQPEGNGPEEAVRERGRQVLTAALGELLPLATARGQRLSLETHCYPPYVFAGPEDLRDFVEGFADLGYVIDVAHLHHRAIDCVDWARRLAPRLWGVHVSDAVPGGGLQAGVHLPFSEGTLCLAAVVDVLRQTGYDGFVALEVKGSESAVCSSCAKLLALLGQT